MTVSTSGELIIIGTGFFSLEVRDLVKASTNYKIVGYVEGINKDRCTSKIDKLPVFWIDEILKSKNAIKCIAAIGTPKRKDIIEKFEIEAFEFIKLIHHSAQILSSSIISNGSIISVGSIISAECRIGDHVIINRGCLIGHHVKIGNFVTVSPGANIAGKVEIGDSTYIGMGSIVIDGIKIGKNSIIGAGSVVTKDVPDSVQVIGIPAKITKNLI